MLERFMPFVTPVIRLRAVITAMLPGFAEAPVVVADHRPTVVVRVTGFGARSSRQEQKTTQRHRSQRRLAHDPLQQMPVPLHNILPGAPPWPDPGICVLLIEHLCVKNVAGG